MDPKVSFYTFSYSPQLHPVPVSDDNLLVVYDYFKDGDSSHQRPPSCILATFNADLVLENNQRIQVFPDPDDMEARNHTCGKFNQTLEIHWYDPYMGSFVDGKMIMKFSRNTSVSGQFH